MEDEAVQKEAPELAASLEPLKCLEQSAPGCHNEVSASASPGQSPRGTPAEACAEASRKADTLSSLMSSPVTPAYQQLGSELSALATPARNLAEYSAEGAALQQAPPTEVRALKTELRNQVAAVWRAMAEL